MVGQINSLDGNISMNYKQNKKETKKDYKDSLLWMTKFKIVFFIKNYFGIWNLKYISTVL